MDHEVVPWPCKICDWLLHSPRDYYFRFILREKCQSGHEVWGTQKMYLNAYIVHWHGPTGFAVGETKEVPSRERQGPMTKKWCSSNFLMNFFGGGEDEDKRMVKLEFCFFLSTLPCLGIYMYKINTFTFGAWSFLLVHIQFTPSEGGGKAL